MKYYLIVYTSLLAACMTINMQNGTSNEADTHDENMEQSGKVTIPKK